MYKLKNIKLKPKLDEELLSSARYLDSNTIINELK